MFAQHDSLPYREIEDQGGQFSAGAMVTRMIDGLGFRYYWATEGLRDEDNQYRPTDEARSTGETIDHIMSLSFSVVNTAMQEAQSYPENPDDLTYNEKRAITLRNLKQASTAMRPMSEEQLGSLKVIFAGGRVTEYPYWNMLNGPLADAIYHTGQIVTMRRSSGNPINPNISVFTGKVRD